MKDSQLVDSGLRNDTDSELTIDIVIENSFRSAKPSIASTGLRTHALRYDTLRKKSAERVAEEFLINSRLRRGDAEMGVSIGSYLTDLGVAMLSQLGREGRLGNRCVSLPNSVELVMSLGEVIRRRRSVRKYSGDAIPLSYLATIIRAASGITEHTAGKEGISTPAFRSTPSGGALYPIDLYVAALSVESLSRGVYVYDSHRDVLWQTGDVAEVNALLETLALPGQVISEKQASAVCLLVGRPWRSMRKYGARGMRYVFIEAGAIAEHINLAAVALGLGSVDCGSFYDDEVHEAIEIDGLYETLIHTVFLGTSG
jgi:SagB-type dehydrogenase family enzyme